MDALTVGQCRRGSRSVLRHTMNVLKKLSGVKELPKVDSYSEAEHASFFEAVSGGNVAKVDALLKANPRLAVSKDSEGKTALHLTASCSYKQAAEPRLANSADVNAKDSGGRTPLHRAASKGRKRPGVTAEQTAVSEGHRT